jgi:capsule polysaccharide export protein KpsE/RkpR
MEEEKNLYPGEISIEEFTEKVKAKFIQLRKHWMGILIVSILFGLAGWFYAKQLPEYYAANILFIMSSSDKQQSQDNLIAQQLGLGQKGSNEEGLYTVQNFLGLLVHSKMIRETLLLPYPTENTHTFASKYMSLAGENERGIFTIKEPFNPINKEQISLLRSLAEQIRPALVVKPAADGTSFTQFSGRFENEEFAKYFTESLLNYTLSFYVEGKTKEIKNNIRRIEERKDSLLRLLTIKSRRIANQQVQSIDLNPAYSSAMVEGQIMSNEGEFLSKLYSESVASLEVVKSELRQQTPLFTIIEGAEYPLVLEIPARMKWFWAMLVLGFLLGVIYFGLRG